MSTLKNIFNKNTRIIRAPDTVNRKTTQKIPKSMLVLFLSSQLLFGFDFGFSSIFKKKYRSFVKRFSFLLSIVMIVLLISPLNLNYIYYWFNIVEYISYCLVLNFTKYSAYHFIIDVNKIFDLNQNNKKFLCLVGVYNIAGFFIKAFVTGVSCKADSLPFINHLTKCNITYTMIHCVSILSMDVIATVQIVLMYYIKCCVRHLKDLLTERDISFGHIEKYYIDIANRYDKIKPLCGRLVSNIFTKVILQSVI